MEFFDDDFLETKFPEFPEMINPYKVLEVSLDSTFNNWKTNYRIKRNHNNKKLCNLAYHMLCNRDDYYIKDNLFKPKKKNHFYYVLIGDLDSLMDLVSNNSSLLRSRDKYGRSLLYLAARNGYDDICRFLLDKGINVNEIQSCGSTALHGASYYGNENVIDLLLAYGADPNIKNNFGHFASEEAYKESIKDIILNSKEDKIYLLSNELIKENLAKNIILIKKDGQVVGKKIMRAQRFLPRNLRTIKHNWLPVWHGTNYKALKSIMELGLKLPGTILKSGEEIKPKKGHIGREVTVDDIDDWANAIFVSQSIFYSADPCYSEVINSNEKEWCIIVEARVKKGGFKAHNSTVKKYSSIAGEPTDVEFRVEKESNIFVVSILFVERAFLKQMKSFEESSIFVNSEEEICLERFYQNGDNSERSCKIF